MFQKNHNKRSFKTSVIAISITIDLIKYIRKGNFFSKEVFIQIQSTRDGILVMRKNRSSGTRMLEKVENYSLGTLFRRENFKLQSALLYSNNRFFVR